MNASTTDPGRLQALAHWRSLLARSGWFHTCPIVEIDVVDAVGRVTAEEVFAVRSVPHYDGSAMDGFAVRAVDTMLATPDKAVKLKVLPPGSVLQRATAVVVDTGDALPPGADSVIMKEHVANKGQEIEISTVAVCGQHVRRVGEDMVRGDKVIPAGRSIGPVDVAACLAVGADRIKVRARPKVCVIPTGTEIVDSAEELAPGAIRDINSYMLAALFSNWGAQVRRHVVLSDDQAQLRQAIAAAVVENDLVVINAGTSGGTEDFTATVLAGLGQVCCHGVAIRPGRPVILAVVDGKPVVGLPGYPVSCLLTAELFTQELLYEYQKKILPKRQTVKARLAQQVVSRPGVEEFLRVSLTGGGINPVAVPLARGASLISTLTQAQGLLRIEPETDKLNAGEMVVIELF
jgi:putative molybdopterin biosynthesis protein